MSKIKVILVERGVPDTETLAEVCDLLAILSVSDDLEAAIVKYQPDVVVLDMPVPKKAFLQSLKAIQQSLPTPVVIFSQDDARDTIAMATEAGVMAYVIDSLHTGRMVPILDAAIARFNQYASLKEELSKTKNELASRKVIERAKGIIMKQRDFSEDKAYRLMRDSAMSQNRKLIEIAENIISAAEILGA